MDESRLKWWKISTGQASIDAGRRPATIYVRAEDAESAAQKMSVFVGTFMSMASFDIEEIHECPTVGWSPTSAS